MKASAKWLIALSPLLLAAAPAVSPLFGVSIPIGYRDWQLVGVAHEADPLNELRAVLGNATAIAGYRQGSLPFPDGTILVKLAWEHVQSEEYSSAFVPGSATTVQVMIKDSIRYAGTGGWGFGKFVNGSPVGKAEHQTCFACHEANVRNHDFVFTRFAR